MNKINGKYIGYVVTQRVHCTNDKCYMGRVEIKEVQRGVNFKDCPTCGGDGYIEFEVPLQEALERLGRK